MTPDFSFDFGPSFAEAVADDEGCTLEKVNLSFLSQSSQRTNWPSSTFLKEFQTRFEQPCRAKRLRMNVLHGICTLFVLEASFAWFMHFGDM